MINKIIKLIIFCLIISACGKFEQKDDNQSGCTIGGIKIYNNYYFLSNITLTGNIDGNAFTSIKDGGTLNTIIVNAGNHSVQIYASNGSTCYNNTVYIGGCYTLTINCP